MLDKDNKRDSCADDLKKALLYSTTIILIMWLLSVFVIK